jgi:hypothetical protein
MEASQLTSELNFNNTNADAVVSIPAVKEIVLDGDYLIVGIDVSCPLKEILHCLCKVIKQYLNH